MKKELLFIIVFIISINISLGAPGNKTNATAEGGNTTYLDLDLQQGTSIWQGFFGRITGGIVLSNGNSDSIYDWNVVEPKGEVFASRITISDWSNLNCTNQTQIYQEEERLNITNTSSDGINDTFQNTTHPTIEVGGRFINGCRSTLTDNSTEQKVVFWNLLLNSDSTNTVYTGIIDANVIGFNGSVVDYQLIVPVNTTQTTSLYYIYTELS